MNGRTAVVVGGGLAGITAALRLVWISVAFGLLSGEGDEYIVSDGAMKGQRGFFTRDADGRVTGVDLAGRLFTRAR